ncbi:MAG: hypothetical protein IPG93_20495 [Burkholderiales bacterium]|nr:hypothetical protein [Burkholderiales bacterium]
MTSKHTDDDRWLAALAGQAEPDDAQTRQAASLRRYLELQDEREAPLERRAAGRMARRLQAGLAAAQAGHADPATQAPQTSPAAHSTPAQLVDLADLAAPTGQTAPMPLPAARVSGWSRVRAWCFPPVQGHGGHYAGAGALAVVLATALILAPGWWSRSEAPAQADERLAMAEPTRQIGAKEVARDTLSTSRMVLPPTVAPADVPPVAPLVAPPAEQDAARANDEAGAARLDKRAARGLVEARPPVPVAALGRSAAPVAARHLPQRDLPLPAPARRVSTCVCRVRRTPPRRSRNCCASRMSPTPCG